jgi:hypothetical protein
LPEICGFDGELVQAILVLVNDVAEACGGLVDRLEQLEFRIQLVVTGKICFEFWLRFAVVSASPSYNVFVLLRVELSLKLFSILYHPELMIHGKIFVCQNK